MALKLDKRTRMPASAPCKVCGRKFSRNDSLTRHLKVHGSHVERGPVHRIINDKFRARSNCRRAKVRCPGSTAGGACARCSQNQQQCTYDKTRPAPSPPKSPDTQMRDILQPIKRPMLSPRTISSVEPVTESPRTATTPPSSIDMSELVSHGLSDHELSLPGSPPASTPAAPSAEVDNRTSFLVGMKDLPSSNATSTYVSPTMHILDPYSYKLPSIAESNDSPSRSAIATCRYPVL